MTRAMRTQCPDEEVFAHLVRGYVRIALEETDLLAVSLTERLYLPATVSERIDRVQADCSAEWPRWLSIAAATCPRHAQQHWSRRPRRLSTTACGSRISGNIETFLQNPRTLLSRHSDFSSAPLWSRSLRTASIW